LVSAGSSRAGPFGFHALGGPPDTTIGFDVTLHSDLPVADFAAGLSAIVAGLQTHDPGPQMAPQEHYEQGGTWSGRLRIGDLEVEASGLFVRDHSWGVRNEQRFQAFWTATCLEDGRRFCNAIGIPSGERVVGVGVVVDASGATFTQEVGATFAPRPGLATYDRVEVRYGEGIGETLTATAQVHVPIYLPHSGPLRYDNNALSMVEMGGLTGFGVMEWADVLEPDQGAALDAARSTS
jgi:hypothetical protein